MNNDNNHQSLELTEHIRLRSGMYIGKLGEGSNPDDGIYTLLKVIIDNAVDEFRSGYGRNIDISIKFSRYVSVRDYGRGIPFSSIAQVVTHTVADGIREGKQSCAKYKSVGMGGIGLCVVMALSKEFKIYSYCSGQCSMAHYIRGVEASSREYQTHEPDGLQVVFVPDDNVFGNFSFREEYVSDMIKRYSHLNGGLELSLNREPFLSPDGLKDRVRDIAGDNAVSEPVHLVGQDIEIAFTQTVAPTGCVETYVNGHRTKSGGPHEDALMEALAERFDVNNLVVVMNIRLGNPVFVDQGKNELGSKYMWEGYNGIGKREHGQTIKGFIKEFLSEEFLHPATFLQ